MPSLSDSAFRVFLSYSHQDRHICDAVCAALRSAGVVPWSDSDLRPGTGFTRQIQTNITHSHMFMPILTPQSHAGGWVHQEIGFAVAMRVPCVPICVGKLPDGMIAMAHSVVVDEQLTSLEQKIGAVRFTRLVEEAGSQWEPSGETALEPEDRALMIERYSNEALDALGESFVRIQGGLTSFSLPRDPVEEPVWTARYAGRPRTSYSLARFRRERLALEKHAEVAGVRLIANHGLKIDEQYGPGAKRTRLAILVRFLESLRLPDELVQVALVPEHPPHLLLAVGDWFVAESLAGRPVRGVLHTVFTSHAPTVNRQVAEFDAKLARLLAAQGTSASESRSWAIGQLQALMRELPPHPAWSGD